MRSAFCKLAILPVTSLLLICLYDYFGPKPDVINRFEMPMNWHLLIEREQAHCCRPVAKFTKLKRNGKIIFLIRQLFTSLVLFMAALKENT